MDASPAGWEGTERRQGPHTVRVQLGQYAPVFAGMTVCLFIVLGVLAYGIINTNNRAREVEQVNRRIALCLLEQFAEHRENTSEAHDHLVNNHNFPMLDKNSPTLKPEDLVEAFQKSCEEFIR